MASSSKQVENRFGNVENSQEEGWREQNTPSDKIAEANGRDPRHEARYAVGTKGKGFGELIVENLENPNVPSGEDESGYRVVYWAREQEYLEPLYINEIEVNEQIPIELEYFGNSGEAEEFAEEIVDQKIGLLELIGEEVEYSI